jgi:ABC-type transport system involved in cytochrome bd biosynthesis fused ATPase/permease subunit
MYAIPIVLLILLALVAVAWSPVFALVIAVPLFIAFLAYVGGRPRADERRQPPTGSAEKYEDDVPTGAWGERRS